MVPLPTDLRKRLESVIPTARTAVEAAARAALTALAVERAEPFATLTPQQRRLRNALRAKARQLGGGSQTQGFQPLVEEIAYQQWHRMLFARFLAENGLLMHPSGVPVTLADCTELAPEDGDADAWAAATRYASAMLPGIFLTDDPAVQVQFSPEGRYRLESLLNDLPAMVFIADDSLGWMYQFWQKNKKEEVNASERKIGGADLAPVTQLFTEDYMVRFLLENSLGAWWAARHPDSSLIKDWQYLRWLDEEPNPPSPFPTGKGEQRGIGPGRQPAAGTFPGWSERAAEVTVMDPCCGSGHFLVAAFDMLRKMRMEEEGLGEAKAADAVLRDNLFGLELDPRCTQIAAFALALTAWKAGGYRQLPIPNIACSGIPVQGQLETWLKLAGGDTRLRASLERLYNLFKNSPDLGSLINPADLPLNERMFVADYEQVLPLLEQALAKERQDGDPAVSIFGAAVEGVAKAARLLAGKYTLVATNVPYLGRGKQGGLLKNYGDVFFPESKQDLATMFLERSIQFCDFHGSSSLVTPQTWLFLKKYAKLRKKLLCRYSWNILSYLGAKAFETIGGEVVNVILTIISNDPPKNNYLSGILVDSAESPNQKASELITAPIILSLQENQLSNPDCIVILRATNLTESLAKYATIHEGMHSGDYLRFGRCFWEFPGLYPGWCYQQGSPDDIGEYLGRENVLFWEDGQGELIKYVRQRLQSETVSMWIKGHEAWGKRGIAVSPMSQLATTLYTGEIFTHSVVVIISNDENNLGPLWAFCKSKEFREDVRKLDRNLAVAVDVFRKIPFNLEKWRIVSKTWKLDAITNNDPSQWVFQGHPDGSTEPLQVSVARLLGYCWPQQKPDNIEALADENGIACLPSVAGESPAVERLRALLAAAYGKEWSHAILEALLAGEGYAGKDLGDWLRDGFFAQHCKLFHNRPFNWHIWDGRKDGFSALVNYHRLDAARLEKLIYTYLGDWIRAQREKRDAGEAGTEGRLVAALELMKKLEAIREGEPPYDIYVRWKPLHEQPIGWNPDLNDGVRLNIRPFVTAGVLRSKFTINWGKDRGKNPDGSERWNDLHFTNAQKREARKAAK